MDKSLKVGVFHTCFPKPIFFFYDWDTSRYRYVYLCHGEKLSFNFTTDVLYHTRTVVFVHEPFSVKAIAASLDRDIRVILSEEDKINKGFEFVILSHKKNRGGLLEFEMHSYYNGELLEIQNDYLLYPVIKEQVLKLLADKLEEETNTDKIARIRENVASHVYSLALTKDKLLELCSNFKIALYRIAYRNSDISYDVVTYRKNKIPDDNVTDAYLRYLLDIDQSHEIEPEDEDYADRKLSNIPGPYCAYFDEGRTNDVKKSLITKYNQQDHIEYLTKIEIDEITNPIIKSINDIKGRNVYQEQNLLDFFPGYDSDHAYLHSFRKMSYICWDDKDVEKHPVIPKRLAKCYCTKYDFELALRRLNGDVFLKWFYLYGANCDSYRANYLRFIFVLKSTGEFVFEERGGFEELISTGESVELFGFYETDMEHKTLFLYELKYDLTGGNWNNHKMLTFPEILENWDIIFLPANYKGDSFNIKSTLNIAYRKLKESEIKSFKKLLQITDY